MAIESQTLTLSSLEEITKHPRLGGEQLYGYVYKDKAIRLSKEYPDCKFYLSDTWEFGRPNAYASFTLPDGTRRLMQICTITSIDSGPIYMGYLRNDGNDKYELFKLRFGYTKTPDGRKEMLEFQKEVPNSYAL